MSADTWQIVIALVALIVATATLWLVIVDRIERSREVNGPSPEVTALVTVGTHPKPTYRVHLQNAGSHTAQIFSLVARNSTWTLVDRPLPRVLAPHQEVVIEIDAPDIDAAWFNIAWASNRDRRWVHVEWLPMLPGGAMHKRLREQMAGTRYVFPGRRWIHRRRQRGLHVGPDGLSFRSFRVRPGVRNTDRYASELAAALRGHDETFDPTH